jgi:fumarate reductase flavoprotein subunit
MTSILKGKPPSSSPHMPVVIVGAGACGLVAGLMLRDAGGECVLLERDASPSGSSALSSGFIPAAGTSMQRLGGVLDDDAARFAADIQAKAKGTAAAHLVQAYSESIAPALEALQSRHGLALSVLDGFLYPGHSVRRMHAVPEKTGSALVARLLRAAQTAGADVLTQATVSALWVDDANQITGVAYTRPDGAVEHLGCDALILACNGFGGNAELVHSLLPEMRGALFAGHVGNDGSAIAWGKALGARLADLGGYQGHGSWAVPQGALITWALMMQGGVQLNAEGERFHNETLGYSEAAVHVLAQPRGVAWCVFDEPLLKLAQTFPDFCDAQATGAVKTCDSTEALAQLIGCDTIKCIAINQAKTGAIVPFDSQTSVETGGDDDGDFEGDTRVFNRALQAPLYAIKVTGALFHTQGGLDIDAHCRVLHEDDTAFPNLLAAGGAARGVSGNAVWGYLSGNGLLSAIAGGFIAASTVVQQLQTQTQSSD